MNFVSLFRNETKIDIYKKAQLSQDDANLKAWIVLRPITLQSIRLNHLNNSKNVLDPRETNQVTSIASSDETIAHHR